MAVLLLEGEETAQESDVPVLRSAAHGDGANHEASPKDTADDRS